MNYRAYLAAMIIMCSLHSAQATDKKSSLHPTSTKTDRIIDVSTIIEMYRHSISIASLEISDIELPSERGAIKIPLVLCLLATSCEPTCTCTTKISSYVESLDPKFIYAAISFKLQAPRYSPSSTPLSAASADGKFFAQTVETTSPFKTVRITRANRVDMFLAQVRAEKSKQGTQ